MAFALRFGHRATESSGFTIDGKLIKGDPRRATGVHIHVAMRVDDDFKNTCMVDLIGASVSIYDTRVKLVKAHFLKCSHGKSTTAPTASRTQRDRHDAVSRRYPHGSRWPDGVELIELAASLRTGMASDG